MGISKAAAWPAQAVGRGTVKTAKWAAAPARKLAVGAVQGLLGLVGAILRRTWVACRPFAAAILRKAWGAGCTLGAAVVRRLWLAGRAVASAALRAFKASDPVTQGVARLIGIAVGLITIVRFLG